MRFVLPILVFLAVSAFHTVLPACLESAEKKDNDAEHDGLTELKKIDQEEFEAAQREEAAQMNITVEEDESPRYLVAEAYANADERGGYADTANQKESESESSEEGEERHEVVTEPLRNLDKVSKESSEEQDGSGEKHQ